MKIKKILKNKIYCFTRGVSMIEALILIFIFSVVTLSFYSVFAVGSKYILDSKSKIIAISLANQRMEMLRNLGYDSVATVGGIPSGPIDPDETVTLDNKDFRITTDIRYYDDPDDGVFGGSPNDNVPNDYKIAEVIVYWGGESERERATLSSRFVPPGVENAVGGGTFSINTIDYAGNPVPSVSVNVYNSHVTPTVNYSTHTDTNGNLLLQGVPADAVQNYKLTFSKTDYETVVTYDPLTTAFIPEDAHSNIIEGALNEKTVIIDLLSNIALNSKNSFGEDLPGVTFDMIGGRRLDDGTVPPGVFSYTDTVTTDGDGEFSDDDINAGKYSIDLDTLSFASGDYEFRKISNGDDLASNTFNLIPGTSFSSDIIFMDKNIDSAYISVKDSGTGAVIAGASVKLTNTTLGYDVTLITDKYGYVYFPQDIATPLQNGETYDISVSATGYQNETDTITINKFTTKGVTLSVS